MEEEQVKKKSLWEQLQESRWKQVLFFMVSMGVLVVCYSFVNMQMKSRIEINHVLSRTAGSDIMVLASIENVILEEENITFVGVACQLVNENADAYLVLRSRDGSDSRAYKTKRIDSEFNDTYGLSENIGKTGYVVTINSKELLKDSVYDVFLDVMYYIKTDTKDGKEERYRQMATNYCVHNRKVCISTEGPEVLDDNLKEIIKNGELCCFEQEKVWIYLYKGNMYWLMQAEIMPELEEVPGVRIYIYSDRGDLIPENDIEKFMKEGYVYREFILKETHYSAADSLYVLKFELPTEYPITYMRTGVYTNGENRRWIFRKVFTISDFEKKNKGNVER